MQQNLNRQENNSMNNNQNSTKSIRLQAINEPPTYDELFQSHGFINRSPTNANSTQPISPFEHLTINTPTPVNNNIDFINTPFQSNNANNTNTSQSNQIRPTSPPLNQTISTISTAPIRLPSPPQSSQVPLPTPPINGLSRSPPLPSSPMRPPIPPPTVQPTATSSIAVPTVQGINYHTQPQLLVVEAIPATYPTTNTTYNNTNAYNNSNTINSSRIIETQSTSSLKRSQSSENQQGQLSRENRSNSTINDTYTQAIHKSTKLVNYINRTLYGEEVKDSSDNITIGTDGNNPLPDKPSPAGALNPNFPPNPTTTNNTTTNTTLPIKRRQLLPLQLIELRDPSTGNTTIREIRLTLRQPKLTPTVTTTASSTKHKSPQGKRSDIIVLGKTKAIGRDLKRVELVCKR